jgi:hypothetical protein
MTKSMGEEFKKKHPFKLLSPEEMEEHMLKFKNLSRGGG